MAQQLGAFTVPSEDPLQVACYFSFGGPLIFWPQRALGIHMVHRHPCWQNTHTEAMHTTERNLRLHLHCLCIFLKIVLNYKHKFMTKTSKSTEDLKSFLLFHPLIFHSLEFSYGLKNALKFMNWAAVCKVWASWLFSLNVFSCFGSLFFFFF